jgi:hypothetical protein
MSQVLRGHCSSTVHATQSREVVSQRGVAGYGAQSESRWQPVHAPVSEQVGSCALQFRASRHWTQR